LGDWQLVPVLQSYLDQWAAFLSGLPQGIVFAALLLPVALGVFSKRVIVPLACTLLAAIALCAVAAPTGIAVTLATGAYFGGLIVAAAGLGERRRIGVLQAELANLRADVDGLLSAEEQHYLTKLRSPTEEKER
jgi:hypothetical protein